MEGEPVPEGPQVGDSREVPNSRKVGGDYLLSREKVDMWAKATLKELLPNPVSQFTDNSVHSNVI